MIFITYISEKNFIMKFISIIMTVKIIIIIRCDNNNNSKLIQWFFFITKIKFLWIFLSFVQHLFFLNASFIKNVFVCKQKQAFSERNWNKRICVYKWKVDAFQHDIIIYMGKTPAPLTSNHSTIEYDICRCALAIHL